jgi:membrane fusion protein (multidrug efflux system)|tara:strand:+ start:14 stop:1006 length:993 start_codon:yes stop_codon:yes gene_type:complete
MKFFFLILLAFFYQPTVSQQLITVGAKKPLIKTISDTLELPALLLANETVQITTVVSEKIKKIHFKEGSFVKKNQTLIEFVDEQEQAIKRQILAELNEAELNFKRADKLFSKGNISQTILDNRKMLKEKLEARLDEIDATINDLKISAPFAGITSIRNFSEGSLIKPGDIITTIYDITKLKIQAKVPEIFINKISTKTNFFLTNSIDENFRANGVVSIIDPLIDDETRTFKIIGLINNKDLRLKPGLMVSLKFNFEKRESFFVRENAVFNQDNISYLYLVDNKNEIKKIKVKVGSRKDGFIEILKGLNSLDLVVYEGINKIKVGSKVIIQ